MIALLTVEWRRVLARRLVPVSAALAVLAVLGAGAIAFLVARDTDAASLAQAQAARQAEVQRCIAGQLEGVPADVPPDHRAEFCEQGFIPPVPDRRFHYEHLPEILVGTSGFAIILGWLLGASLVGAEAAAPPGPGIFPGNPAGSGSWSPSWSPPAHWCSR